MVPTWLECVSGPYVVGNDVLRILEHNNYILNESYQMKWRCVIVKISEQGFK